MDIALDMMGGDYAPEKAVEGIIRFLGEKEFHGTLSLIGDQDLIRQHLSNLRFTSENINIIHTTEVIGMDEHPTKALREKRDSSIAVGFRLLSESKTDAFISAGSTGAMMVGALYSLQNIPGVIRPAIGAYLPQFNGSVSLLIDVGLNTDCKPESLDQFGRLGSLFSQHILGLEKPRVALLNIGEEENKGNLAAQAAYRILKNNAKIHFTGNLEGRDLLAGKADIFVCDGFTGNILLKFAEAFYGISQKRNVQDDYFSKLNFEIYGGVPILGVEKTVIIGHGISGAEAFSSMIKTAEKMIENNFTQTVKNAFILDE